MKSTAVIIQIKPPWHKFGCKELFFRNFPLSIIIGEEGLKEKTNASKKLNKTSDSH